MRSHRPKLLLLLPLLAGLSGCWGKGPAGAALSVDHPSPPLGDRNAPLLLNDAITIYFSDSIRPTSVTEASVTLIDENGHHVPGAPLRVGTNWVAWVPKPPLAKDLSDGSFRPGGHYRLVLAGMPRPDRIRSQNGRSLASRTSFDVYIADHDQAPEGLPAILRPTASDLPLMLRTFEVTQHVAADDPRLQLHFTLPVLPSSLRREAFRIQGLHAGVLIPRSVRVVTSPLDDLDFPGSTIEIDLGSRPEHEDGERRPLADGDFISVRLLTDSGLVDYAGRAPLPQQEPEYWSVVAGRSVPICEWPDGEHSYASEDSLRAGFEVRVSSIVPRVRVEAGNGSLGVFRPTSDMTLRPGEMFDRGDGKLLVSAGSDFHFSSIEIPEGVKVTVDATGRPVRLLSCGGVHIDGSIELVGSTSPLPSDPFNTQPVQDLIDAVRVSVVAAGDLRVRGDIKSTTAISESETALMLATAGWLHLQGSLPFQSVLVAEARGGESTSRIEGVRGQSRPYPASFNVGLAKGADFEVVGVLPWRRLPPHLDSGLLQIGDQSGDLSIVWQSTAADAIRGELPDLTEGHIGGWQYARDRDVLVAGGGAFVRMRITARVRHGQPLPSLSELRLVEN
ncbi:MAG: hypothetical protein ACI89X_000782 [Planctomycetota bacterium]|jgi:hypothetical protein